MCGNALHMLDEPRVVRHATKCRSRLDHLLGRIDQAQHPIVRLCNTFGFLRDASADPGEIWYEVVDRGRHARGLFGDAFGLAAGVGDGVFGAVQRLVRRVALAEHRGCDVGHIARFDAEGCDPFRQRFDIGRNLVRRAAGFLAEFVDRLGHNGKALAAFASAGGFDLGVDGKRVDLHGNGGNLAIVAFDSFQGFAHFVAAQRQRLNPSGHFP